MQKKVTKVSIFLIIFTLLMVVPISVNSSSYSFTLTEIGSVIPTNSVINFQCIDNELIFILAMTNELLVVNITDPSNVVELFSYYQNHPHDIELDLIRELVFATSSGGVSIFSYSDPSNLQHLSTYKNYTYSTFKPGITNSTGYLLNRNKLLNINF